MQKAYLVKQTCNYLLNLLDSKIMTYKINLRKWLKFFKVR